MKKEYLILGILILLLSAYLVFHKDNQDHYTLPDVKTIDTKNINKISVSFADKSIVFNKKDKEWTLTDKAYPADASKVLNMLDSIKGFKLTALVSSQGDLKRYELDDNRRIHIQASDTSGKTLAFYIGKPAPSYNHTFVMLEDDKNIYHANGSLRTDFQMDIDDFRDKKVLEVKEAAIKQFTVKKGETARTLIASRTKTDKTATTSWKSSKGKPADKKKVSSFLASISFLRCDTYLGDTTKEAVKKNTPVVTIKIDAAQKISFSLYQSGDSKELLGISSMNGYPFSMSAFDSREILSSIDTFLGIPAKKTK